MNEKNLAAGKILTASKDLMAREDYVYDPDHKNRPHGGGTWYKTPKGWTTHKPSKNPHKQEDNPKTSLTPEQSKVLRDADNEDANVREDAARSEHATREVFEKLKNDEHTFVRQAVAERAPADMLDSLAEDEEPDVRFGVAMNPNAPESLLRKLADDDMNVVAFGLAQNDNTPNDILDTLAKDEDDLIRKTAKDTLNRKSNSKPSYPPHPEEFYEDYSIEEKINFASDEDCPIHLLETLSNDDDPRVRENVAKNPKTDKSILQSLSYNKEDSIRKNVVNNPNVTDEILEKLSKDKNEEVRNAAKEALNRKNPQKALDFTDKQYQDDFGYTPEQREIAKKAKSSDVEERRQAAWDEKAPIDVLAELSRDEKWVVRSGVAQNPMTHPDTLADLADDENWQVKLMVAKNPNTPSETLDKMSRSGDQYVQNYVAQNIGASPVTLNDLADIDNGDIIQNVIYNPKTSDDTLKKIQKKEDFWADTIDKILEKRKTTSSELKKKSDEGDEIAKQWLHERKQLRHDFCEKEIGDETTYSQMKNYKKSIGEKKGYGRSPEQVKQDFIRNMDPSKYGSPEEFQRAKKNIQDMPTSKFDSLLGIIYRKAEEDDDETADDQN